MRKEERTENTFPTSDDAQPTLTPTTSDSCEHPPEEVSPASVASRGRRVPRVTTPVSVAFHPPGMTTGPRTRAPTMRDSELIRAQRVIADALKGTEGLLAIANT
ncbi:hypothetical protein CDAR_582011 [Caerostris darwini]|uniref:Uncharacterized protein n=1 Tax=Caerostris darwini TaxID=1538125 RepID=A0AAV4X4T2_9ARAC|nr:hypothetical protein CDAR_582011 [Caerostris darwini]